MTEKVPQLTEEQKLIVEKLKSQQDKVGFHLTVTPPLENKPQFGAKFSQRKIYPD